MIGPSPKSMWPNLIELVDSDKPNTTLNYRLKANASDDDKRGFEKFENGENAFFLKSIYKELKEPYYTWEGQVVERSSLENRELPLVDQPSACPAINNSDKGSGNTLHQAVQLKGLKAYNDKKEPEDLIWWVDDVDSIGPLLFSFDKKTIYNFWTDYPDRLTPEQIEIFRRENPTLAALK